MPKRTLLMVPEDLHVQFKEGAHHLGLTMNGLFIIGAARYLKAHGLWEGPLPRSRKYGDGRRGHLSDLKVELIKLLRAHPQGLTEKEILKHLGIGRTTFRTLLTKLNVQIDSSQRPQKYRIFNA